MRAWIATLALAAAACTPPAPETPAPAAAPELAPEAMTLIQTEMPGFTVTSVESEEISGQTEYEVAGSASDGAQYEFDMMHSSAGWSIVEIQRDIAWADAPAPVRDAAAAAPNAFEPVRVIESRQPVDGSVIYELFTAGADAPAMEVRLLDGEAGVMPPPH